jgi:hypothetical protein
MRMHLGGDCALHPILVCNQPFEISRDLQDTAECMVMTGVQAYAMGDEFLTSCTQ